MEILWDPKLSKTATAAVADVVANALLHATGIYVSKQERTDEEGEEGEEGGGRQSRVSGPILLFPLRISFTRF